MSYTSKGIAYTYVIQKAGTSAMAHMTVWADKRDLALAKTKRMLAGSNLVRLASGKAISGFLCPLATLVAQSRNKLTGGLPKAKWNKTKTPERLSRGFIYFSG